MDPSPQLTGQINKLLLRRCKAVFHNCYMTCKWQTLPKKSSALRFCSAIRPTVYSMGFLICRLCVQISHTCEKCNKWRALGSEVLFIQKRVGSENSPHCCVCMPKLHLVKKVVSCNRRVLSSRQIFMLSVKKLNQWSQQDGALSSRTMISNKIPLAFRKCNLSCKQTWNLY